MAYSYPVPCAHTDTSTNNDRDTDRQTAAQVDRQAGGFFENISQNFANESNQAGYSRTMRLGVLGIRDGTSTESCAYPRNLINEGNLALCTLHTHDNAILPWARISLVDIKVWIISSQDQSARVQGQELLQQTTSQPSE